MNKRKKHQEGLLPKQAIHRRTTTDEPDYYRQFIRSGNMTRVSYWIDMAVSRQAWQEPQLFINEIAVCYLHALCMNILLPNAGDYRVVEVEIWKANKKPYRPPKADKVPHHMKKFVEDLNKKWHSHDLIQIASFALWRLNWIHPFENGNGRTSRAFSYFLMSMKEKDNLPVRDDHSVDNLLQNKFRREYEQTLEEADNGNITPLEKLLKKLLIDQLSYALARK